jgi:hypothetical protein
MEDNELINLKQTVGRQEQAVTKDAQEIAELKADVRELLSLVNLFSMFAHRDLMLDAQDKAAKEFQKRLGDMLEKYGIAR